MAYFALELVFDKDNDRRLAVRPTHREYLRGHLAEGRVAFAGPWADDSGALIVLRTDDEAEARAIVDGDPYLLEDVVTVKSLREWNKVLPSDA